MPTIRIPKNEWGKVWRTLVASGPVSRLSNEPLYAVSDEQVKILRHKKLPFKIVTAPDGRRKKNRNG